MFRTSMKFMSLIMSSLHKKDEKYYRILEHNLDLPEQHVDRARIYNRLGIIHREEGELNGRRSTRE